MKLKYEYETFTVHMLYEVPQYMKLYHQGCRIVEIQKKTLEDGFDQYTVLVEKACAEDENNEYHI